MVTDVCDPAIALLMDRGLVGAAALQVAVSDESNIFHFRLLLGRGRHRKPGKRPAKHQNNDPCFTDANLARHRFSVSEFATHRGWRGARLQNLGSALRKSVFAFSVYAG